MRGDFPHFERFEARRFDYARRAVVLGEVRALEAILKRDPGIVILCKKGGTLLHHATGLADRKWSENHLEVAETLIQAGAKVNAGEDQGQVGETPLIHAIRINNVDMARLLLRRGARIERTGRYDGYIDTPLGYALFYGLDPGLKKFEVNGWQMLVRDGARLLPPFLAALGWEDEFREWFEGRKSISTYKDPPRETIVGYALLLAARWGRESIVRMILDSGHPVNQRLPFFLDEPTALHYAVLEGHTSIAHLLLERGADPHQVDGVHQASVLTWALQAGQVYLFQHMRYL